MLIPNNAAVIGALSGGGGGGGLQSVSHNNSLSGNGTADSPLAVKISNRDQNALSFVDDDTAEGGLFVERLAGGVQVITGSTSLDPGKPIVIVSAVSGFIQQLPTPAVASGEVFRFFCATSSAAVVIDGGSGVGGRLEPGNDAAFYSDGQRWITLFIRQSQNALPPTYALFGLSVPSDSNMAVGDHCPFDQAEQQEDPNKLIALGTADYTTQPAILCKGRVRLRGGYVYDLTGQIASVGDTKYFGYSIWNVTDGSPVIISSNGAGFATKQYVPSVCAATATGIVQPLRDMLIELRLTGGEIRNWFHGSDNLSGCYLKIVCLGRMR
ncbi:hypothetical protein [Escherichia coli]|uniref:hypothetical protein n=1 Tax=Escherichia coli TaxID=562 RepID=UPI00135D14DB|nr:hypothetical protein [Escherichia coli]MXF06697.1 hypothetical protein [Escherichia coli]